MFIYHFTFWRSHAHDYYEKRQYIYHQRFDKTCELDNTESSTILWVSKTFRAAFTLLHFFLMNSLPYWLTPLAETGTDPRVDAYTNKPRSQPTHKLLLKSRDLIPLPSLPVVCPSGHTGQSGIFNRSNHRPRESGHKALEPYFASQQREVMDDLASER